MYGTDGINEKVNEYLKGPISNLVSKIRLNPEDVARMDSELIKLYFSEAVSTADKIISYVEVRSF